MSEAPARQSHRDLAFLAGGGEMGALIRAHDWSRTSLGAAEAWPQSLRTMISACLNTPVATAILWGPELRMLHNDAGRAFLAERQLGALGQPASLVLAACWDGIAAPLQHARRTGECVRAGIVLPLGGSPDTASWDLTAAPIRGEDGEIAGLFLQAIDTTQRVRLEGRIAQEQERQRSLLQQMPGFVAVLTGPDHVYQFVNDAYIAISGPRAFIGRGVREVFPELDGQGFYELLDQVYGTGTPFTARSMPISLLGEQAMRFIDFLYCPTRGESGAITGIFVGGYDVTEAVCAQRALKAERDRLASVLEGMEEGFALLDRAFKILDINAEGARLEGQPREALIGRTVRQIHPGIEETAPGKLFTRAMKERLPAGLEHHFVWPDGRAAWLDMRVYPLPEGLAVFYRDVTSRHEVEERLQAERERVQFALDAGAIAGTWVWDVHADRFTADERFAHAFDLDPDRCRAGLALEQVTASIHAEDRARVDASIAEALLRGGRYRCEYRVRRGDGSYRWIEANGLVERDADGIVQRFPGVLRDIQPRREAEAERDEAASLLRNFTAAVPGVVYAKDRQGRLLVGNHGTTQLIGRAPEFYIGKTDAELLEDKAQAAAVMATDARIMASGQPEQVEEYVDDPDGNRVVWLSNKAPLRNAEGEVIGLIGSSVDITARKRAEAALEELNATLEQRIAAAIAELRQTEEVLRQSQKMEAVGQLTGGIAHDFNNMLAVVIGSLDLLDRRLDASDARARRYVDAAMDGARRAALLTQRLLAFSRQQPLRPEALDANALIAGMSELLRHSLGAAVEMATALQEGLCHSFADPNQLENVLLNLAVNARDAMPDGGRLTIETRNTELEPRYAAAHPNVTAGAYVMIAVSDTGSGMTAEVIGRAFEPFFTTKEVGRGTGLGLSQVYGFIRQSGGHVKIYSEPGQGTTVKLYLPRAKADGTAAVEAARTPHIKLARDREVVLVVEDEPAVRQFSVDALTELGYRVIEADGAKTALDLLALHPEISLMFTDVVMPHINGAKLAQAAQRMRPSLKIIFTTGYTRNAVTHNGVLDPGVELIGKPFTMEELATRMRTVLDG